MITKEEAKKLAESYLSENGNEYVAKNVCEKPWEGATIYGSGFGEEEVYYVQCGRKQLRGLESSMVLIRSRSDGGVLSFQSAHDEG